MKKQTESFLHILKDARFNQKTSITLEPNDFYFLYKLAHIHDLTGMVYNQIYHLDNFPDDLKKQWGSEAKKLNVFQIIKTQRFLQVYREFLKADLKVYVVKGLVCRNIYPTPDNRPSNDEDLYIERKDADAVTAIFENAGFQLLDKGEDEIKFLDYKSGLTIELHLALFSKSSQAYGFYQVAFDHAFETYATHMIEGVQVYSLSHDQHFLFLVLHFAKHFLHGGVGIRQLMDIIMYIEAFKDDINWNYIFKQLDKADLVTFFLNTLEIAHVYLDFDYDNINLCNYKRIKNEYQELLDDIMESGIFGQTTQERIHSSTITLNAMESGKVNVLKSVFPPLEDMKGKFPYLNEKPYLLPVAQATRILNYMKHHDNKQNKKTVELGNKRVELLKKYKILNK